ncbi:endonuclease/exonuclease/phosphatase family protein [Phaeovulum sp.]|uniref:endonuclease/exonuclease/phosphatase family protein n=1 Tax=Phaeovulum sp. TaxID=2934796 RepID=UPI0027302C20|nr:endonuclease/exonuclease/phosphatase family protein [Phaeovulum sp.]MDP1668848.1 endonuclease/exonuclease/phosphatase family protein [Phaeovulum sp.]MDZ4118185.1 endonuclease/exonuclease/phosphatase family protein [Phaeovulum sp.]
MNRLWVAGLAAALLAVPALAETLRFATFNADLSRAGPGLLLQDLRRGSSAQVAAVVAIIAATSPDVLLLTGIDWDHDLLALRALEAALAAKGAGYGYLYAPRPNAGMATGFDLDGDGRLGGARDAQGYGRFTGEGGMALLSRLPILAGEARDFSGFLWRDLPDSLLSGAGLSPEIEAALRLSSMGHWDVPLRLPGGGTLHVLAFMATPPVFDGPEDLNGRRNHDEAAFWLRYLEGALPQQPPSAPLVLMGDANLDPVDGEGRPGALRALLAHPSLQDPAPASAGGVAAAAAQGGPNATQAGDPARDTVDWPETGDLGNRRVDYVLPWAAAKVRGSGVVWPAPGAPLAETAEAASRHRLVWVDIDFP